MYNYSKLIIILLIIITIIIKIVNNYNFLLMKQSNMSNKFKKRNCLLKLQMKFKKKKMQQVQFKRKNKRIMEIIIILNLWKNLLLILLCFINRKL